MNNTIKSRSEIKKLIIKAFSLEFDNVCQVYDIGIRDKSLSSINTLVKRIEEAVKAQVEEEIIGSV